jgi:hypothetical protein
LSDKDKEATPIMSHAYDIADEAVAARFGGIAHH